MNLYLEQIVNGLGLVGPILLVSLSLSTVLAATRVLNVAVGATVIWSAYAGMKGAEILGTVGLFAGAILSAVVLSAAIELLFLRWQRRRAREIEMASFASTLGLASAVTAAFVIMSNGITYVLPSDVLRIDTNWTVGGVRVRVMQLLVFGAAVALTFTWAAFLRWRPTGKMYRALASNRDLAQSIGMRADRISLNSWIFCGVFIGIAAALILGQSRAIDSNSGAVYLLVPFAAVVAGGMGSLAGTVLAATFFGLSQSVLTIWFSQPGYRDAVVFLLLFGLLAVRPQGLLPLETGERDY
jgi:branched-chain amino acid transport system permease protein